MAKVWSFNTTIRNPERMENMLRALSELEGKDFDENGQRAFFGLQIKKRLYKPEKRTLQEEDLIDAVYADTADEIGDSLVQRILDKYSGDVDSAGRGRTAAGILNRFGLCVALQSNGPVVISDLGKKWLEHEVSDEELFTKFLLKWQYPNKIEKTGYSDFDIRPFVATLKLISLVNKNWADLGNKPVGLSKLEYQLFVPSLTKADQIENYANKIVTFRTEKEAKTGREKTEYMNQYAIARAKEIFGEEKDIDTALSDLKDYTDSSVRYFRISGLIALRGGDTHIDIAKDKEIEVKSIIEKISPHSKTFASYQEYFDYISDLQAVPLPWQNEAELQQITTKLTDVLKTEAGEEKVAEYLTKIEALPVQSKVESLESKLNEVRIQKLKDLRHDVSALDECIQRLESITSRNYDPLTARPSLDLEWYTSRALMVLNDATDIVPSYTIGDDGIPTGFRANVSDIECYYQSFGMTVETTLLLGRDQWYAEGQPVMRHHRNFEDKAGVETTYCIFVAPFVHRDTLNTFWGSNVAGYEGKRQKIIPLSLEQFVSILKVARDKIVAGRLSHTELSALFKNMANQMNGLQNPHDWLATFPQTIEVWANS